MGPPICSIQVQEPSDRVVGNDHVNGRLFITFKKFQAFSFYSTCLEPVRSMNNRGSVEVN